MNIKEDYQDLFKGKELPFFRYKPESAFSWSAGLGIQKQVKRNPGVKAYVSYFDSNNDFTVDVIDQINSDGNYTFKNQGSEKVKFNHITFGLGLTAFLW
ncbi:hypothetical protein EZ449_05390 [Pedobacter frigidisoli]|uniref:Outer membrane protein beta-barrel domain-containing protein n=1 Tax=Pedobacter frigidisoli TaxID=2530455 RepID=A0A4R0P700_9SPHI|nr:hypothetical protein [Pedobacter frigidisoli]TCD11691.1 hypothetical protein EZ449_05390 [Pedobacter frigidisoli]